MATSNHNLLQTFLQVSEIRQALLAALMTLPYQ